MVFLYDLFNYSAVFLSTLYTSMNLNLKTTLKHVHVNKFRYVLTKFRLSAHNLNIESGRHNDIDRIHRKMH